MAVEYFMAADEIYDRVVELINSNHPDLFIVSDEILVMFRDKAAKVGGEVQLGKARKATPLQKALFRRPVSFILELAQGPWEDLTFRQQEALLDHLLMSCRATEDPQSGETKLRIVPPDLLAFRENVARYGLWFPQDREEGALRLKIVKEDEVDELAGLQESIEASKAVLPAEA